MLSEEEFITLCFKPLLKSGGSTRASGNRLEPLSLEDDAALLRQDENYDLILSKDILLEGQHFRNSDPPELIAKKALAVNLSDLAAKGASPLGFMLGIALPEAPTKSWSIAFSNGLREMIERYSCPLIGGDTTGSKGGLVLSVTIMGEVPKGKMIKRRGALPGDLLFISGSIGDAALGFQYLNDNPGDMSTKLPDEEFSYLISRYQSPTPRLELGALLQEVATAAMDLSDGLIKDLPKLCNASGVRAQVKTNKLPLSKPVNSYISAMTDQSAALSKLISWGDDYEILFTAPPSTRPLIEEQAIRQAIPITEIGSLKAAVDGELVVSYLDRNGTSVSLPGTPFDHFKKND